MLFAL